MADSRAHQNRSLTFDEVTDFFLEKNINSKCPTCNEDNTAIICDSTQQYASIYPLHPYSVINGKLGSINTELAARQILVECENCGAYRNFSTRAIYTWLDEKNQQKT